MTTYNTPPKWTAIESFCGAGGLSLGLQQAGFDVALAFDSDETSIKTYNANHAPVGVVANAKELSSFELLERAKISVGELDLFSGGPPCQGFSKQKRGAHKGDDRNDLVLRFSKYVSEIKPKAFMFENVATFGQKRGKAYLSEMKEALAGYSLNHQIYNAADYGLAQTRERFIMVGIRNDIGFFTPPPPTTSVWKTVQDSIGDLPSPPDDYSVHTQYANHQAAKVSALNIERFAHVPQGGGWKDIPFELRLPCHQKADVTKGGWPDVYGRLEARGQSPTITGGFDSFTRGRYGHPHQNRPLTPREAARLQGFPDDFVFKGNRGDWRQQIGNAVPPPLAKAIAEQILLCLSQHNCMVSQQLAFI